MFSFSYLWFNHQSNCNTFHNYINLFLAGELLRARYSPIFPLKIEDHTTGLKDPSIFWIAVWVLLRPLSIDEEGWMIQGQLLNVTAHLNPKKPPPIWTPKKSNYTHLLGQGSCKKLQPFSGTFQGLLKNDIRFLEDHLLGIWFHRPYKNAHSHSILIRL